MERYEGSATQRKHNERIMEMKEQINILNQQLVMAKEVEQLLSKKADSDSDLEMNTNNPEWWKRAEWCDDCRFWIERCIYGHSPYCFKKPTTGGRCGRKRTCPDFIERTLI